jgi:cysteine desulfurase
MTLPVSPTAHPLAHLQPAAPPHPAFAGPPDRAPIYLDYNATTPIDPRVTDALQPALREVFGNPSSSHGYGPPARTALDHARTQVAALIGAESGGRIVFTGSGSEADALAIRGTVLAALADHPDHPDHPNHPNHPNRWNDHRRPQVITQATEHPAVLAACRYLSRWHGVEVTVLPVDHHGRLDPTVLAAALTDRTVLVTVMHANNETGTLQPIAEQAGLAHQAGAVFHTDAAQTAGKIPLHVVDLGVDLLTLVGHKMYAPKGIAALYARDDVRLEPLIGGGGQETGLRAGTENVALAAGLGAAAELAAADLAAGEPDRLAALRDRLHRALDDLLPGRVQLNGHPTRRRRAQRATTAESNSPSADRPWGTGRAHPGRKDSCTDPVRRRPSVLVLVATSSRTGDRPDPRRCSGAGGRPVVIGWTSGSRPGNLPGTAAGDAQQLVGQFPQGVHALGQLGPTGRGDLVDAQ